jgi:holo-[acyl-carrier protein] synthase
VWLRTVLEGRPKPCLRVGTDIVEVARVEESLARFGERYVSRVYTQDEAKYCSLAGRGAALHFAARFAAKEAAAKVLRLRDSDIFDWRSIEVIRTDGGSCELRLHALAQKLARRAGLSLFALSLSHEERYATAVVLAEQRARPWKLAGNVSRNRVRRR